MCSAPREETLGRGQCRHAMTSARPARRFLGSGGEATAQPAEPSIRRAARRG
jgi:hypothetical protein